MNNDPCCDWVGEDGAGHFVKMVHNGIEYGDMQLICEAYNLMKDVLGTFEITSTGNNFINIVFKNYVYNGAFYYIEGMEQGEMAEVFEQWNKGDLDSFLIEISRDILKFKDTDG